MLKSLEPERMQGGDEVSDKLGLDSSPRRHFLEAINEELSDTASKMHDGI